MTAVVTLRVVVILIGLLSARMVNFTADDTHSSANGCNQYVMILHGFDKNAEFFAKKNISLPCVWINGQSKLGLSSKACFSIEI